MEAAEHLKAGRPDDALTSLREAVRKRPADPKLRQFLYQLLALNGQWERALNQLQVLAQMQTAEGAVLARLVAALIRCEGLRAEVFAGRKTPLIFGEPEPWLGLLVEASGRLARGETEAAARLQAQALAAAPARAGRVNGAAFAWIADADSRLGPVLEAMLEGSYYWLPFQRIARVTLAPPAELRDLIWAPAKFTWTNGGETAGFLPARYPGSESSPAGGVRLARQTDWTERAAGVYLGLGQRLLTTDVAEYPLLEVRALEFD